MATVKGVAATNAAAAIPVLTEEGQYGGKYRVMYDTITLAADLSLNDLVLMGTPLPEGAKLLNAKVKTGALGGSCTLDVGWQASADAVEAADATAFFSALPASSAGSASAYGSTYEGDFYGHVLAAAAQPVIKAHAATSGATGLKIQLEIHYIVD